MSKIFENLTGENKKIEQEIINHLVKNLFLQIEDLKKEKREMVIFRNQTKDSDNLIQLRKELMNVKNSYEAYKKEGDEEAAEAMMDDIKNIEAKIKKIEGQGGSSSQEDSYYDPEKLKMINFSISELEKKIDSLKKKKNYSLSELEEWKKSYIENNFSFTHQEFIDFLRSKQNSIFTPQLVKLRNLLLKYLKDLNIKTINSSKVTLDNFFVFFVDVKENIHELVSKKEILGYDIRKELHGVYSEELQNYIENYTQTSFNYADNFRDNIKAIIEYKPPRIQGRTYSVKDKKTGREKGSALESSLTKFFISKTLGREYNFKNDPNIKMLVDDSAKSLGKMTPEEYLNSLYLIVKRYAADFGGAKFNIDNLKDRIKDESTNKKTNPIDFNFNGVGFSLKRHMSLAKDITLFTTVSFEHKLVKLGKIINAIQEEGRDFPDIVWVVYSADKRRIKAVYLEDPNINNDSVIIERYPLKKTLYEILYDTFRVPHHMMIVSAGYVIFINLTNINKNINKKSFSYPVKKARANSAPTSVAKKRKDVPGTYYDYYFHFKLKKPADLVIYRISDQVKMTRLASGLKNIDQESAKWTSNLDKVRSSNIIGAMSLSNTNLHHKKRYSLNKLRMRIRSSEEEERSFKISGNFDLTIVKLRNKPRVSEKKLFPSLSDFLSINESLFNFKKKDPKLVNLSNEYKEQASYFSRAKKEVKNSIATRIFSLLSKNARTISSSYNKLSNASDENSKSLEQKIKNAKREVFSEKGKKLEGEALESVKRLSNQLESNSDPERAEKISQSIEDLQKAIVALRKFK